MFVLSGPAAFESVAETGIQPGFTAGAEIRRSLRRVLAEVLSLYLNTKSFQWLMRGRHLRGYDLLLDVHGDELFSMKDEIDERVHQIGGTSLHLLERRDESGHKPGRKPVGIASRSLRDDTEESCPARMLKQLCEDNLHFARSLRCARALCERHNDVITSSLFELWIDQTELRVRFLTEIIHQDNGMRDRHVS